MNRRIAATLLGALVLVAGAAVSWAWYVGYFGTPREPLVAAELPASKDVLDHLQNGTKMVRVLATLHDRIVKGDAAAASQRDQSIEEIGQAFLSFGQREWANPRNFEAMMAYVLGGGRTEAAEAFLNSNAGTVDQAKLAKGAVSFALRRTKTALKLIGDVEPRTVDRPLIAPLALALASLHATSDVERGLLLFDEARLHAPGTAIEEAAIRREVPMLLQKGDTANAEALTARYVRAFGASLFADTFQADVAKSFASLDEAKAIVAFKDLAALLNEAPVGPKSSLYLAVARSALLAGKLALGKLSADAVVAMGDDNGDKVHRAKLYSAAAQAPTEMADIASHDLQEIPAAGLDDEEIAIRDAAQKIANKVLEAAVRIPQDAKTSTGAERLSGGAKGRADSTKADLLGKSANAVKLADELLSAEKK